jgi:hypothetical protein
MNIRQGMFRLWIIASVLFVIAIGLVSYRGLREQFRISHTDWDAVAKQYGGYSLVPTFCHLARGNPGTDYETRGDLCWYRIEDFRLLYSEYKDLNDQVLSEKLYEKVGQPLEHQHPWRNVAATAGIALGVPLAVLIFGYSLGWAFAGFRGSSKATP